MGTSHCWIGDPPADGISSLQPTFLLAFVGLALFAIGGSWHCSIAEKSEMAEAPIIYKELSPTQIAFLKTRINNRDEIPRHLELLKRLCEEAICGDSLVIFHRGRGQRRLPDRSGVPGESPSRNRECPLPYAGEPATCSTSLHYGSLQTARDTVLKIHDYLHDHA